MAIRTPKVRVLTKKWKQGKSKTKVPQRSRDTLSLHLVVLAQTLDLSLDLAIEKLMGNQTGILRNLLSPKEGVLQGRNTQ